MTATVIDVSANLASSKKEDSVTPSALVTKPTSTENVNATMESHFTTESALPLSSALSTVSLIPKQTAVCVNPDSQSSEENAPTINIVESMDTLSMANATATLGSSGSTVHADLVELTKDSMVSHVNVSSATLLIPMETVFSQTFNLPATKMKDTIPHSRHVFASLELNTSEENALVCQPALLTPTTTVLPAFVKLDINSKTDSASLSTLWCPLALRMHSSTVSHAAAMLASIRLQATLVVNALKELAGMEIHVVLYPQEPVLQDISSTKTQINASLQPPHVEISPTSTEHAVSV